MSILEALGNITIDQITNLLILIFTIASITILEHNFSKAFSSKDWIVADLVIVYLSGIPAFKIVIFEHISGWELWINMLLPIFAFISSITCITVREWVLSDRIVGEL